MGRRIALFLCWAAVACGDDDGATVFDGPDARADARPPPDGRADAGPFDAGIDAPFYQHTILVDGMNLEWLSGPERFDTTTAGYYIWMAWDSTYLYLALDG